MKMKGFSPKEFAKILKQHGWQFSHRNIGGHVSYTKSGNNYIITYPEHRKEISRPMAKRLLKDAGINLKEVC